MSEATGIASHVQDASTPTGIHKGGPMKPVEQPVADDGRRNSNGEPLVSPTVEWKPSFLRKQSYEPQDLKRSFVEKDFEKFEKRVGEPNFTEGGEGGKA